MSPEDLEVLRSLLTERRQLAISVLIDGEPAIGLLPFVVAPDYSSLIVRASGLARHTKGLLDGAPFDALIQRNDDPVHDALQLVRTTLRGKVTVLDRDAPETQALIDRYVAAFPSAAMTLDLGDFNTYRLGIEAGRLITGFGGAINLSKDSLEQLRHAA
ncbi:MAG: hypothetical protein NDJ94_18800 [Vicinamibacteria bacterium]|jgi:hypothetical protein|nr:hypothetical protein [Vicinamibacteria bacterium]